MCQQTEGQQFVPPGRRGNPVTGTGFAPILAGHRVYDTWCVNEDAEYHEAGDEGAETGLPAREAAETRPLSDDQIAALIARAAGASGAQTAANQEIQRRLFAIVRGAHRAAHPRRPRHRV